MNENILNKIDNLIKLKKIDQAQMELSKLGPEFYKNSEYLYLRSKIFYINKLYYLALDALLIATEFEEKDKIYDLISKIYNTIGNKDLSEKIGNQKSRKETVNFLKSELTGVYQKKQS
tara:strand:- start:344 stop:697 length:354 start_codon:yes stop_codon:yes gene_type:complete